MNHRPIHPRLRKRSVVAILALVITGTGLLVWRAAEPEARSTVLTEPPAPQRLERQSEVAVTIAPPAHLTAPEAPTTRSADSDQEGLIAGPGEENRVPGAKPHPISRDHVRLQEEIALFKAGTDAVAARDVPEIRRIVQEHRASYPDQNQDMADGYEILADCIEHPGAASTARARRFFDEETYSMIRRPILRTCLDGLR